MLTLTSLPPITPKTARPHLQALTSHEPMVLPLNLGQHPRNLGLNALNSDCI